MRPEPDGQIPAVDGSPTRALGGSDDRSSRYGRSGDSEAIQHRRDARSRLLFALAPTLPVIGLLGVWGGSEGGFLKTMWLPGAILCLGLLAATAYAERARTVSPGWPVVVAVASLAAFTGWSYLSLLWAESPGDAWESANRTLLYLLVFVLFALRPWSVLSAIVVLVAYIGVTVAVGVVEFAGAVADANPVDFIAGRLARPAGYQNANAALFIMAFWPAVVLAAQRSVPPVLRAACLAGATFLAELALLSQSRASIYSLPLVAGVLLILVPGRLRVVLALALPIGAVVIAQDPLLRPYGAEEDATELAAALAPIPEVMLASSAAVGALGLAWALLDRRIELTETVSRRVSQVAAGFAAVAAVVVVGYAVLELDPVSRLDRGWEQFTTNELPRDDTNHLSAGFGSNRNDFWRVSLEEFRRAPLVGAGGEGFAIDYLRDRESFEEPAFPHSLEMRILGQLGLVGAVTFAGFLVAAALAAFRRRPRNHLHRAVVAASLMPFVWWLVHGSVDWLWEFPALSCAALAMLGVAAGLGGSTATAGRPRRRVLERLRLRPLGVAALVVAGAAAATSFALPWLAARHLENARDAWRSDPAAAYAALDAARSLDRLSDEPDIMAGAIAARRHDDARAELAFRRAIQRNAANWYAYMELALLASYDGRAGQAQAYLRRAKALNPRESLLVDVLEPRIRRGERIHPSTVDQIFFERSVGLVTSD